MRGAVWCSPLPGDAARGIRNDEVAGERPSRGSRAGPVVDTAGHGRDPPPTPARGRRGARRGAHGAGPAPVAVADPDAVDPDPVADDETRPAVLAARPHPAARSLRAAHPRQAVVTALAHGRRRGPGRPAHPRAPPGDGHGARRPGLPRLVQRPRRPRPRRPAPRHGQAGRGRPARPGHGVVRPGDRGVRGRPAVDRQRRLRRLGLPHLARPSRCSAPGSGSARASSRGCRGRRRSACSRRSSPTAAGAARTTAPRPRSW